MRSFLKKQIRIKTGILNQIKIKHRIIATAIGLSLLSVILPIAGGKKINLLSNSYDIASKNWKDLELVKDYARLLTDSELRLRAFASTENRDWLLELRISNSKMKQILDELSSHHSDDEKLNSILNSIQSDHLKWEKNVLDRSFLVRNKKDFKTLLSELVIEPIAYNITQSFDTFTKNIREKNQATEKEVKLGGRSAKFWVSFSGFFFFLLFFSLMTSLLFTLLPDLGALLQASYELKSGNLKHRVHLEGKSETAELGRAFNEMANALEQQNEKLKELNQLKTDFVSTVSHELRTPLTAIKGSIDLVLGGVTGPVSTDTKYMLEITQKNTDRLIRLINDVLDVAKIEEGAFKLKFEKFGIVDLISHEVKVFSAYASKQNIKLKWAGAAASPLVVIDRDRIIQVLANLLSNAVKFTPSEGEVEVSLELAPQEVWVHVKDNGPGIPEEFLGRIFEKFQQVESSAKKSKQGTGLGLTVAKAIVEEHEGKIKVQSKEGYGSTFSFSIPWNGKEFEEKVAS